MRRTHVQASSLIILLSIITIIAQFAVYYFFAAVYIIWGISILMCVISCHILQEQTATYEACFNYSVLIMFISSVITALSYLGEGGSFLPYTGGMLGIIIINWLIPCVHCFLRNMLDYGTRFEDYRTFYRNDSLLFIIIYIGIILYGSFVPSAFPWAYTGSLNYANFIPFEAITLQIEDYLYGLLSLGNIILYLACRIFLYIPYGYQINFLLRKHGKPIRLAALLVLPILIEIFQYIIIPVRFDIDDIIYALIGGILGSLLFGLCNLIVRAITGRDFLSKDSGYSYSGSRIHF
jgi:glycopeptide antibiotics resistance protein